MVFVVREQWKHYVVIAYFRENKSFCCAQKLGLHNSLTDIRF